jgi:hypothetical protein
VCPRFVLMRARARERGGGGEEGGRDRETTFCAYKHCGCEIALRGRGGRSTERMDGTEADRLRHLDLKDFACTATSSRPDPSVPEWMMKDAENMRSMGSFLRNKKKSQFLKTVGQSRRLAQRLRQGHRLVTEGANFWADTWPELEKRGWTVQNDGTFAPPPVAALKQVPVPPTRTKRSAGSANTQRTCKPTRSPRGQSPREMSRTVVRAQKSRNRHVANKFNETGLVHAVDWDVKMPRHEHGMTRSIRGKAFLYNEADGVVLVEWQASRRTSHVLVGENPLRLVRSNGASKANRALFERLNRQLGGLQRVRIRAATVVQSLFRGFNSRSQTNPHLIQARMERHRLRAAILIQSAYKGHRTRKSFRGELKRLRDERKARMAKRVAEQRERARRRERHRAAQKIQGQARGRRARHEVKEMRRKHNAAANVIQRNYRAAVHNRIKGSGGLEAVFAHLKKQEEHAKKAKEKHSKHLRHMKKRASKREAASPIRKAPPKEQAELDEAFDAYIETSHAKAEAKAADETVEKNVDVGKVEASVDVEDASPFTSTPLKSGKIPPRMGVVPPLQKHVTIDPGGKEASEAETDNVDTTKTSKKTIKPTTTRYPPVFIPVDDIDKSDRLANENKVGMFKSINIRSCLVAYECECLLTTLLPKDIADRLNSAKTRGKHNALTVSAHAGFVPVCLPARIYVGRNSTRFVCLLSLKRMDNEKEDGPSPNQVLDILLTNSDHPGEDDVAYVFYRDGTTFDLDPSVERRYIRLREDIEDRKRCNDTWVRLAKFLASTASRYGLCSAASQTCDSQQSNVDSKFNRRVTLRAHKQDTSVSRRRVMGIGPPKQWAPDQYLAPDKTLQIDYTVTKDETLLESVPHWSDSDTSKFQKALLGIQNILKDHGDETFASLLSSENHTLSTLLNDAKSEAFDKQTSIKASNKSLPGLGLPEHKLTPTAKENAALAIPVEETVATANEESDTRRLINETAATEALPEQAEEEASMAKKPTTDSSHENGASHDQPQDTTAVDAKEQEPLVDNEKETLATGTSTSVDSEIRPIDHVRRLAKIPTTRGKLEYIFSIFGDQDDGYMDSYQFEKFMQLLYPPMAQDQSILGCFISFLDQSRDGKIDFEEFANAVLGPAQKRSIVARPLLMSFSTVYSSGCFSTVNILNFSLCHPLKCAWHPPIFGKPFEDVCALPPAPKPAAKLVHSRAHLDDAKQHLLSANAMSVEWVVDVYTRGKDGHARWTLGRATCYEGFSRTLCVEQLGNYDRGVLGVGGDAHRERVMAGESIVSCLCGEQLLIREAINSGRIRLVRPLDRSNMQLFELLYELYMTEEMIDAAAQKRQPPKLDGTYEGGQPPAHDDDSLDAGGSDEESEIEVVDERNVRWVALLHGKSGMHLKKILITKYVIDRTFPRDPIEYVQGREINTNKKLTTWDLEESCDPSILEGLELQYPRKDDTQKELFERLKDRYKYVYESSEGDYVSTDSEAYYDPGIVRHLGEDEDSEFTEGSDEELQEHSTDETPTVKESLGAEVPDETVHDGKIDQHADASTSSSANAAGNHAARTLDNPENHKEVPDMESENVDRPTSIEDSSGTIPADSLETSAPKIAAVTEDGTAPTQERHDDVGAMDTKIGEGTVMDAENGEGTALAERSKDTVTVESEASASLTADPKNMPFVETANTGTLQDTSDAMVEETARPLSSESPQLEGSKEGNTADADAETLAEDSAPLDPTQDGV